MVSVRSLKSLNFVVVQFNGFTVFVNVELALTNDLCTLAFVLDHECVNMIKVAKA